MAVTTTEMSKIKQLLRYLREGNVSNRKIARIVGLNKETVNNYARKARECIKRSIATQFTGLKKP